MIKASNIITLAGVAGFTGIVGYLHFVQKNYSPVNQLMSELALGEQGFLMLFAFLSLALSILCAALILREHKAHKIIFLLTCLAALAMAGAGVFKLNAYTNLHVGLVAIAFVLLGLVMYLVPRYVSGMQTNMHKLVCWGLGFGTAMSAGLGGNILPIGLGQRGAACFIILWLSWLAFNKKSAASNILFRQ
jgi:hypothetical membrane protein